LQRCLNIYPGKLLLRVERGRTRLTLCYFIKLGGWAASAIAVEIDSVPARSHVRGRAHAHARRYTIWRSGSLARVAADGALCARVWVAGRRGVWKEGRKAAVAIETEAAASLFLRKLSLLPSFYNSCRRRRRCRRRTACVPFPTGRRRPPAHPRPAPLAHRC
jgi:hypothetical protein